MSRFVPTWVASDSVGAVHREIGIGPTTQRRGCQDNGSNDETRKVVVARMKEILDQTQLVRLRPNPVHRQIGS